MKEIKLPKAKVVRPFVGDNVLFRGVWTIADSPIKNAGRYGLFAAGDGGPFGLPKVIGSIAVLEKKTTLY